MRTAEDVGPYKITCHRFLFCFQNKYIKGDHSIMARFHDGQEIDRATHSTNFTEFTVKKAMWVNM